MFRATNKQVYQHAKMSISYIWLKFLDTVKYKKMKSHIKIRGLVATTIITLLTPLLVLSQESIKAIYDSWFKDCTLVIRKSIESQSKDQIDYKVRLYVRGSPPSTVPLTFRTEQKKINRISLRLKLEKRNLWLHPLTGKSCPTALCPDYAGAGIDKKDMTLELTGFSDLYDYEFQVELEKTKNKDGEKVNDLNILVIHDSSEIKISRPCKLEMADVFNILVWADSLSKFFILVFLFVLFSSAIWALRRQ